MHTIQNELAPDLLGIAGINPLPAYMSSSRMQMLGSHKGQSLVPRHGGDTNRMLSGIQRELSHTSFAIRMPVNAEILKVIDKYPRMMGDSSIRENPLSVILYENAANGEIGVLEVPRHHCLHQYFGYRYKRSSLYLVKGTHVKAGTVIAESPAVDKHGNAMYGVNANVIYMSIPGIIEDGVVVSQSFAKKLGTSGYETVSETWGSENYMLNLYGDEQNYKIHPDIGEHVREDGLIFARRDYDELLALVEMTPRALRQPNQPFDRTQYTKSNARVVDVSYRHNPKGGVSNEVDSRDAQPRRYFDAQMRFYDALLAWEREVNKDPKYQSTGVKFTPELSSLLVEARVYKPDSAKAKAVQMVQRVPLDEWRVDVTVEYDIDPKIPFKLTGVHGNKGVICQIWPDENMPVDANGRRADIIMDGLSAVKRMNVSCVYEQYINFARDQVEREVVAWMAEGSEASIAAAWARVRDFYSLVSPRMVEALDNPAYTMTPQEHLQTIVDDGIYLYMPSDNPADIPKNLKIIHDTYNLPITPVTYTTPAGKTVTTKLPFIIGSAYIMLLEKTGNDWSAVSSAKLQTFGIPAKISKYDRNLLPAKPTPIRLMGETEVRLSVATVGGEVTADVLAGSNDPVLHKHIVENILNADTPSNIATVIDRKRIKPGNGRAAELMHHILRCGGIQFVSRPSDPTDPIIYPPDPKNPEEHAL